MYVDYELLQRGCDRAREIRLARERVREATPERKAQYRRYNQSEAGRASMSTRGARYRATDKGRETARRKGRETARRKSRKYYAAHKDDPSFRAHKKAYNRELRHTRKVRAMQGEHTLWLMGGCITVNMGRAA